MHTSYLRDLSSDVCTSDLRGQSQRGRIQIVVLVISTWTSNTSNLYSATLTLATLFRGSSTCRLGLWGALVALVAAIAGVAVVRKSVVKETRVYSGDRCTRH